jgi:hypothetical protein
LRYSDATVHGDTKIRRVTPYSFRAPAELLDDFKEAAAAENRSVAGALRNLMEQRVAEHKADRESTEPEKAVV